MKKSMRMISAILATLLMAISQAAIAEEDQLSGNAKENADSIFSAAICNEIDVQTDAAPLPLQLSRCFLPGVGDSTGSGPFGAGWTSNFDERLEHHNDGSFSFVRPDGSRTCLFQISDGVFSSVQPPKQTLVRNSSGYFILDDGTGKTRIFDPMLRLRAILDQNANFIRIGYDNKGQIKELAHSGGWRIELQYDENGRVTQSTNDMGSRCDYEYSIERNLLTSAKTSVGTAATYNYTDGKAGMQLSMITRSDGSVDRFSYDDSGSLLSIEHQSPSGNIGMRKDQDGSLQITDRFGGKRAVNSNAEDGRYDIALPDGSAESYAFDGSGLLRSLTSPSGKSFEIAYDEKGNAASVKRPDGATVEFGYDPTKPGISLVKDALGRTTTISRDEIGNPVEVNYPDDSRETFSYYPTGLLKSATRRDGTALQYGRDDRGRLLSISSGGATIANWSYGDDGAVASASNDGGEIVFKSGSSGRETLAVYEGDRTFKYEFDQAGRRTKMTDPDGKVLGYRYDESGRLAEITDESTNPAVPIVKYEYDDSGRRSRKALWNNVSTTYEYDPSGRISTVRNTRPDGEVISDYSYSYDPCGNVISIQSKGAADRFSYDEMGQLTQAERSDGGRVRIEYDAAGNRKRVASNDRETLFSSDEMNQYRAAGSIGIDYDANGNMIRKDDKGVQTFFRYDALGRLTCVEMQDGEITYSYDPLGRLSSRESQNGYSAFLYDGDNIAIEEDADHKTSARYVWGADPGEVLMMTREGRTYCYVYDGLRRVCDLLNDEGAVLEHYRYDDFGEPLTHSRLSNPWLSTGMYDPDTKMYFMNNRFYWPKTARFTIRYPEGLYVLGLNLLNNPLSSDRSALSSALFGQQSMPDLPDFIPSTIALSGFADAQAFAQQGGISSSPQGFVRRAYWLIRSLSSGELRDSSACWPSIVGRGSQALVEDDLMLMLVMASEEAAMKGCAGSEKETGTVKGALGAEKNLSSADRPQGGDQISPETGMDDFNETNKSGTPLPLDVDWKDYYEPEQPCPPNCPDASNISRNRSNDTQSALWTDVFNGSLKKPRNNPLTSASGSFGDDIIDAAGSGSSGSFGLVVSQKKTKKKNPERRITVYERRSSSRNKAASYGAGGGRRALSSGEAAGRLAAAGYRVPLYKQSDDPNAQMRQLTRDLETLSLHQEFNRLLVWQTQQRVATEQLSRMLAQQRSIIDNIQRQAFREQQQSSLRQSLAMVHQLGQLGGVDFSSTTLDYISLDDDPEIDSMSFALKAVSAARNDEPVNLTQKGKLASTTFLAGLSIPNSKFWVNLNPWEPNRIIDHSLSATDAGRVMLLADLQMKRDYSRYQNPCQGTIGADFWRRLEEKERSLVEDCMRRNPGEIKSVKNVRFQAPTRHWIVPDRVAAYGNGREIKIANASLKVFSEPVEQHATYTVNQEEFFISKRCLSDLNDSAKEYGRFIRDLEDELITPLVIREINKGSNYSDLREVYISLALAQWCKEKDSSILSGLIDSGDLEGLSSSKPWEPEAIWNDYVKSFREGDYRCWKNKTTKTASPKSDQATITSTITQTKLFTSGGVDFSRIGDNMTIVGEIREMEREILEQATIGAMAKYGRSYYSGDVIFAR